VLRGEMAQHGMRAAQQGVAIAQHRQCAIGADGPEPCAQVLAARLHIDGRDVVRDAEHRKQ